MLNHVALMGRLTADPEMGTTPNGTSRCSFKLAVDRNYVANGGERQTDFIYIVAWRNTAEFICKYFEKGQLVALEGSIQTRQYKDKQGNNRTAFEVIAQNVYFAESKKKENAEPKPSAQPFPIDENDFEEIETDEEGFPF